MSAQRWSDLNDENNVREQEDEIKKDPPNIKSDQVWESAMSEILKGSSCFGLN